MNCKSISRRWKIPIWLGLSILLIVETSRGLPGDDESAGNVIRFSERLIKGGYSYSYGLDAADLDGDGDIDITSSDTRNFKLYWLENAGQGDSWNT